MDIQRSIAGIFAVTQTKYTFTGTGFLVQGGLVLTCAHVVDKAITSEGIVSLRFEGQERIYTAQIVCQSPQSELDITILKLSSVPDIEPLPLKFSDRSKGNRFSAFGYPQKGDFVGLHGVGEILGLVQDKKGRTALQISSRQVTHGYSGGPIWDENLKAVVGMVKGGYDDGLDTKLGDIAFAVPTETIKNFFSALIVSNFEDLPQEISIEPSLSYYLEKQSRIEFKDKIVDQNVVPVLIREIDLAGIREKPAIPIKFNEFRDNLLFTKQKNAIIVGEAGIGKTTELLKISKQLSTQRLQGAAGIIPIFIELRRFSSKSGNADDIVQHLMREIGIQDDLKDQFVLALKTTRQFLLILDGLNEIGIEQRSTSIRALLEFMQLYTNIQYILSTRYYGFDDRFLNIIGISMACYEIQRWDQQQIELFFQVNNALQLYRKLGTKMQKLCSVPFAAHLLLNVLQSTDLDLDKKYPQNKGELYKSYVEYVFTRRDSKINNQFDIDTKISILAKIAFYMNQNGTLSLKYNKIQAQLEGEKLNSLELVKEIVRNGILKQADEYFLKEVASQSPVEFVHQSLQEYFAAVYVANKPTNEVMNYLPIDNIGNVYWRDVPIYLVGLLDEPIVFIESLLTQSIPEDYMLTAAQCLVSCQMPPTQYHQIVYRIIEEFLVKAIQESRYTKDAIEIVDVIGDEAIAILLKHLDEVDEIIEVRALTGDENIERRWRKYGRIIYILGELNVHALIEKLGKVFKRVKDTHLLYHIAIALYAMQHEDAGLLLRDEYMQNHPDPVVRAFSILAGLRLSPDDTHLNRAKSELIPALTMNLRIQDEMAFAIRAHSAEALGLLGSKEAIDALDKLLQIETRTEPQSSAIKALGYIAFKYRQRDIDSLVVDILIKALEYGSIHTNQWAKKLVKELLNSLCRRDDIEKLSTAIQHIQNQESDEVTQKNRKEILEDVIFTLTHS